MRFLGAMVGVSRTDRVRNTTIRDWIEVDPLVLWVERSQARWNGHLLILIMMHPHEDGPERIAKRIIEARPSGRTAGIDLEGLVPARPAGRRPRRMAFTSHLPAPATRLGLRSCDNE